MYFRRFSSSTLERWRSWVERSTLSLVKLRTKRGSFEVAAILDEAVSTSANYKLNNNSFFSEITDEDIDSLFS